MFVNFLWIVLVNINGDLRGGNGKNYVVNILYMYEYYLKIIVYVGNLWILR